MSGKVIFFKPSTTETLLVVTANMWLLNLLLLKRVRMTNIMTTEDHQAALRIMGNVLRAKII